MGADSRIKDLSGEIVSGELASRLSTLYVAADDTSFSDAKKIKWGTLVNSSVVTNNSNNYQALTPKGFYDSVATESRKGIVELASTAEVQAKSGDMVLTAGKQTAMQNQWLSDWFVQSGAPVAYVRNGFCLAYNGVYYSNSLSAGGYIDITPVVTRDIGGLSIQLNVGSNQTSYNGFTSIPYNGVGGSQELILSAGQIKLQITPDRRALRLVAISSQTFLRVACNVTIILL